MLKNIKKEKAGNSPIPREILSARDSSTCNSKTFLPFIQERDALGRLLSNDGYKAAENLKLQLKKIAFGSRTTVKKKNLLSELYNDSTINTSRKEANSLLDSSGELDYSRNVNAWRSYDIVKENKEKYVSPIPIPRKPAPKLTRLRTNKREAIPPLGAYDTERAYDFISPRVKRIIIRSPRSKANERSTNSTEQSTSKSPSRVENSPNSLKKVQSWEKEFKKLIREELDLKDRKVDNETKQLVRQQTYFNNLRDIEPSEIKQNHNAIMEKYIDIKRGITKIKNDFNSHWKKMAEF